MDNAEILVSTPVPEVPQGTAIPSGEPDEESEAEMADGEDSISQKFSQKSLSAKCDIRRN